MQLQNTTSTQDRILGQCEEFGGKSAEAAQIAQSLDERLQETKEELAETRADLSQANSEIKALKERINELEGELAEATQRE